MLRATHAATREDTKSRRRNCSICKKSLERKSWDAHSWKTRESSLLKYNWNFFNLHVSHGLQLTSSLTDLVSIQEKGTGSLTIASYVGLGETEQSQSLCCGDAGGVQRSLCPACGAPTSWLGKARQERDSS